MEITYDPAIPSLSRDREELKIVTKQKHVPECLRHSGELKRGRNSKAHQLLNMRWDIDPLNGILLGPEKGMFMHATAMISLKSYAMYKKSETKTL